MVSASVEVLINSNMPGILVAFANIDITKHSWIANANGLPSHLQVYTSIAQPLIIILFNWVQAITILSIDALHKTKHLLTKSHNNHDTKLSMAF
jgi:hypothetical protein